MTKLGIGLSGQDMTPLEVVECAQLADELGYDSFWLSEGHGGDQFTTLTACALATKRIKLGTSIVSVFTRSAPTLAMAAACVDHFSNGRFILGLGSSHKVQVEGEHGLAYNKPITRLTESVEIIRSILKDGASSYRGTVLDIKRFDLWFPVLKPRIPIYLAAVFPKMLQVCGEIANGTVLTWSTLEGIKNAVKVVAQGAVKVGRSPKDIEIVDLITTAVAIDGPPDLESLRSSTAFYAGFFPRYNLALCKNGFPGEAKALRRAYLDGKRGKDLDSLVPDAMLNAIIVSGSADECRERIEDYRNAGVTMPVIAPRSSGPTAKLHTMSVLRALAP